MTEIAFAHLAQFPKLNNVQLEYFLLRIWGGCQICRFGTFEGYV
jgi:hypothetical protein